MILADFKLRPLKGSKFYTRIRIFDTRSNMCRAAVADGAMTGTAQAAHCGFVGPEVKKGKIGDAYLFVSPLLNLDAVHELTHAAVHYAREIRSGDLNESNKGEYASAAEELLCRSTEFYVSEFALKVGGLTGML
jgi:hypothetical protein